MPSSNHKSITLRKIVFDKMGLSSEKVSYLIEERLKEKEALRRFASKITKVPETVRVYSPGIEKTDS